MAKSSQLETELLKPVWPEESTAVGYDCCDSVEPTIALFESFSVTVEREYTAHGRWVMAELVAKATASFIADSNVTDLSEENGVELPPFECVSQPLRGD